MRLGFLFLAGVAAAVAKADDFVPGHLSHFIGVCSDTEDELYDSLYRSDSRTASLWLAGEGGDGDAGGSICFLTDVLFHVDRSFEDFRSQDPRSDRL